MKIILIEYLTEKIRTSEQDQFENTCYEVATEICKQVNTLSERKELLRQVTLALQDGNIQNEIDIKQVQRFDSNDEYLDFIVFILKLIENE